MNELLLRVASVVLVALRLDAGLDECPEMIMYWRVGPWRAIIPYIQYDGILPVEALIWNELGFEVKLEGKKMEAVVDHMVFLWVGWVLLIHRGVYLIPSMYRYEWSSMWRWIARTIGLTLLVFMVVHREVTPSVWRDHIREWDDGSLERLDLPISRQGSTREGYCDLWLEAQKIGLMSASLFLGYRYIAKRVIPMLHDRNLGDMRSLILLGMIGLLVVCCYPVEALAYHGVRAEVQYCVRRAVGLISYRGMAFRRCVIDMY